MPSAPLRSYASNPSPASPYHAPLRHNFAFPPIHFSVPLCVITSWIANSRSVLVLFVHVSTPLFTGDARRFNPLS
jgi:predicted N-formylglutamate amidohydrolase